ncbi:cell division protein FtsQ [Kineococcus xinjiangensis]|uniref:Cell division protein FtsQ n=1 Tax=Kineococcus xinjiangensis TaxID=512762 RepID=A0A2S6ILW8_9ACTN|nr:cell division protein FtsQ [Kineococcus xinjiangensis]
MLAGVLVWLLVTVPAFAVREVRVTGTERVPVGDVLALAERRRGEQLLRVDVSALAAEVAALPLVAQVRVERNWPDGLVVRVQERRAVAAVPNGDGRFRVVDEEGTVLAVSETVPAAVPLVDVDLATAGRATLRSVLEVLGGLPRELRAEVGSTGARSRDSVVLTLRSGTTVHWGSPERGARKAEVLAVLLRSEATRDAERLDVSAPDHPAVRSS